MKIAIALIIVPYWIGVFTGTLPHQGWDAWIHAGAFYLTIALIIQLVDRKRKSMYTIFALLIVLGICGCTSTDESTRILRQQGYTEIQLTGYRVFTCSDDDSFHTGFRARSVNGSVVTGTVCSGFLKGATIRLD